MLYPPLTGFTSCILKVLEVSQILHFKPSLDAYSLRSDGIRPTKSLSFHRGWRKLCGTRWGERARESERDNRLRALGDRRVPETRLKTRSRCTEAGGSSAGRGRDALAPPGAHARPSGTRTPKFEPKPETRYSEPDHPYPMPYSMSPEIPYPKLLIVTRNPKPETRYSIPGTRYPIPGTRYPIPDTRKPKPDPRNPIPDTRNSIPET